MWTHVFCQSRVEVALQLQQHRFSKLCQAIASLEPAPINVRIACGKPPQNTNTTFLWAAPTKISVRLGRPHEIQRPCRALVSRVVISSNLSCPPIQTKKTPQSNTAIDAVCESWVIIHNVSQHDGHWICHHSSNLKQLGSLKLIRNEILCYSRPKSIMC